MNTDQTQPTCLHNRVQMDVREPIMVVCLDCHAALPMQLWSVLHREQADAIVRELSSQPDLFEDAR